MSSRRLSAASNILYRYLVFHGGSGSTKEEIRTAVNHGVVKMNVDTGDDHFVALDVSSFNATWQTLSLPTSLVSGYVIPLINLFPLQPRV